MWFFLRILTKRRRAISGVATLLDDPRRSCLSRKVNYGSVADLFACIKIATICPAFVITESRPLVQQSMPEAQNRARDDALTYVNTNTLHFVEFWHVLPSDNMRILKPCECV